MKLQNRATVEADADAVFALLNEPERVVDCLPGARLTGRDGDAWCGTVTVKVGPITVSYDGTIRFEPVPGALKELRLLARGTDTSGSGGVEAEMVIVVDAAESGCVLTIDTDLLIRGKLAQFGRGAIAPVSERILSQFAQNLGRVASGRGGDAPPTAMRPLESAIVGQRLKEHRREIVLVGVALLQGYLWGRAVTIERFHRRSEL